jgi:hypothetical protein
MIDAAVRFGDGDQIAFVKDGEFGVYTKEHGTLFTEPLETAAGKIDTLAAMLRIARAELQPHEVWEYE